MKKFSEIKDWHNNTILGTLSENLKKRNFNSVVLKTVDDIKSYILKTIPADTSVGIGGSVTIRETGIDAELKKRGNKLNDHWDEGLSKEEELETRRRQLTSDFFLTSVNAVTGDGVLVNIDGVGNRVASMIFGPKHVIAVVGINKIAKDVDDAVLRIKNIATPMNAKRLGMETPCVSKGRCVDCKPAKSICKITTIIDSKPALTEFTVILTPLELGY